ncbi:hypothetical protein K450DRAFT_252158 [Umbelopsis ramanniana AG]|uniref:Uncharacterized protein n=1 Tax=Umbelopsis ramanniana AG TaxID=1314678 RepID=A0AAD5E648_UMBRA|nr:uncharacterized protein K450DRAFT_252158 [Umbelopsis ramanniana AG]KAI8577369.1 hypothetical protein K450DRAFT_252158 [Umbelopsis ramanniana AG]
MKYNQRQVQNSQLSPLVFPLGCLCPYLVFVICRMVDESRMSCIRRRNYNLFFFFIKFYVA